MLFLSFGNILMPETNYLQKRNEKKGESEKKYYEAKAYVSDD